MEIGDLLSYQPPRPDDKSTPSRRDRPTLYNDQGDAPVSKKRRLAGFDRPVVPSSNSTSTSQTEKRTTGATKADQLPNEAQRIIDQIESDSTDDIRSTDLDESGVKRIILSLEKRILRNQEMRIKFPDHPEKFMESEVELNDALIEMQVIATVPHFYPVIVRLNTIGSALQLLSHENTDISLALVELLHELSDPAVVTEAAEEALPFVDALLENQLVPLLIQNLERLDSTVKEEATGIHNTLGIIENVAELRPEMCVEMATKQTQASRPTLMQWLLKRLAKRGTADDNKLYVSEILAILLQNDEANRETLGEINGIDILLQQLAAFKRHDPTSVEEEEMMENLFNCLCSSLLIKSNRERFLKGEGLQLMNLMLREKKLSRISALKVLDYACGNDEENCSKLIDILGLRNVFPLFMKTPTVATSASLGPSHKRHRKTRAAQRTEMEEHTVSIVAALLRNTSGPHKQRVLNKFTENDHEKVERLMELHFTYEERVAAADRRLAAPESIRARRRRVLEDGWSEDQVEEDLFFQRLEAGLCTLQLIDCIIVDVCVNGSSSCRRRVHQILNIRGGSIRSVTKTVHDYAQNLGDEKDEAAENKEQKRLTGLVTSFSEHMNKL